MGRSLAMLGVSLVLMAASAVTLPAVAGASSGSLGAASGIAVVPSEAFGRRRRAAAPAPSSSPAPHRVGSKVIVPSTWSMVPSPNAGSSSSHNTLNGVSCVTSSFCMAAGSYVSSGAIPQTLAERWNGTAWSIVASPNTSATQRNLLTSVSCITSSFCVAAGYASNGPANQTLVEQWNGTAWSIVASPDTSASLNDDLYGVSCVTTSFCQAVGD